MCSVQHGNQKAVFQDDLANRVCLESRDSFDRHTFSSCKGLLIVGRCSVIVLESEHLVVERFDARSFADNEILL